MELSKQTITDSLTGLFNRRHFDHLLDSEVRRAAREHRPISLVLIDIDHFKKSTTPTATRWATTA